VEAGCAVESFSPAESGARTDWAPVLFDRQNRNLVEYGEEYGEEPRAAEEAESDAESDADPDSAADIWGDMARMDDSQAAARSEALRRYERAEEVNKAIELKRMRALRKAAKDAATSERQRKRAVEKRLRSRALAKGLLSAEPDKPPAKLQAALLAASAQQGIAFWPKQQHPPGCACAACAAVRAAVAKRKPAVGEEEARAPALCLRNDCACARCVWLRWKAVSLAQRSKEGAAVLEIPMIVRVKRAKAEPKAKAEPVSMSDKN